MGTDSIETTPETVAITVKDLCRFSGTSKSAKIVWFLMIAEEGSKIGIRKLGFFWIIGYFLTIPFANHRKTVE